MWQIREEKCQLEQELRTLRTTVDSLHQKELELQLKVTEQSILLREKEHSASLWDSGNDAIMKICQLANISPAVDIVGKPEVSTQFHSQNYLLYTFIQNADPYFIEMSTNVWWLFWWLWVSNRTNIYYCWTHVAIDSARLGMAYHKRLSSWSRQNENATSCECVSGHSKKRITY